MATTRPNALTRRLQALRSTGPRTPEGKLIASMNSTKHGLSKVGLRPPAEMAGAIEDRKSSWHKSYGPKGPAQQWHFDRLCAESVRLDFCEQRLLAARSEAALRASESWDDDRAAEIAALAAKLRTRPDEIQPKLLQTKHGAEWMMARWQDLLEGVQRRGTWPEDGWNLALDLLGTPLSSREVMSPVEAGVDPNNPASIAEQAIAALEERLEAILIPQDERARSDAESGLSALESPEIRRLERYASDARRRVASHLAELRKRQTAEGGGPEPETETAQHRAEVPATASVERTEPSPPKAGAETNSGSSSAMPNLSPLPEPSALDSISLAELQALRVSRNRRERRAQKAKARRA